MSKLCRLVMRGGLFIVLILVATSSSATAARAVQQSPSRVLTVEDVLHHEAVEQVAIAPDHSMLAYVRWRPTATLTWLGRYRPEVWVATVQSDPTSIKPFLLESPDGRGLQRPLWSPDGSKLVMLSLSHTPGRWRLAIWDRRTLRVTKLGERLNLTRERVAWLGNDRLIVTVSEQQADSDASDVELPSKWAYQSALRAYAGTGTSARVFESGVPFDPHASPQDRLVILGLDGHLITIASGVAINDVTISPDQRYVAFLAQTGRWPLDSATKFDRDYFGYGRGVIMGLRIVDITGRAVSVEMDGTSAAKLGSFQWAPDSRSFAFQATKPRTGLSHLFRGHIGTPLVEESCQPSGVVQSFMWTGGGLMISCESTAALKRREWRRIDEGGKSERLNEPTSGVPSTLWPVSSGRMLIGVADGEVWRLDVQTWRWHNVTEAVKPRIIKAWPPTSQEPVSRDTRVLVLSETETPSKTLNWLDVGSGTLTALGRLTEHSEPVAYEGDFAVCGANESTGTYLTLCSESGNRVIAALNQWSADIVPGQLRQITYQSYDGQSLKAWLLLPPDYHEGKRYPLVTWIYPGDIMSDVPPQNFLSINPAERYVFYPMHLLAARGYAVLMPSIPLGHGEETPDVFLETPKGVLPAVDKVISDGVADPNRLAVMGASFGGLSVFALIAQSVRFKAAISIAGISDLVSLYGTFDCGSRYYLEDSGAVQPGKGSKMSQVEWGMRMGSAPWKDEELYIRNSPLFYAERVQTPVLMIHGDNDSNVSMEQSEEFFVAMLRQGKRARYVQYAGESHALFSPANVRDMWQQFYGWLDTYLALAPTSSNMQ